MANKVMIVDDDPDIVEVMKTILESNDYDVSVAYNGTECLQKVGSEKPDLIILDVMMDEKTEGFHVSYKLRQNPQTSKIPILMLTAIGHETGFKFSPETDEDFLPVDDYVEKPIQPKDLLAKVRKLIYERKE
ncbi:MAG: response regulator [bacterium]